MLDLIPNQDDQSFIDRKIGEIISALKKKDILDARELPNFSEDKFARVVEAHGRRFIIEFNYNQRIKCIYTINGETEGIDFSDIRWSSEKIYEIVDFVTSVIGTSPDYDDILKYISTLNDNE